MTGMTDKAHEPSLAEIGDFIGNPLFGALCAHMETAYGARCDVAYSGDNVLLGWNLRFHKAGRTLCRLYPKKGCFTVLVVIGRRETERAEALLPDMSEAVRTLYFNTQEGMGQRWLLIDLRAPDAVYRDVLRLVAIRRGAGLIQESSIR